jgi:phosphohistidine phosphatase SixA
VIQSVTSLVTETGKRKNLKGFNDKSTLHCPVDNKKKLQRKVEIHSVGSMLRRSLYAPRRIMVSPTLNRNQSNKANNNTITVNEYTFNMPFTPGEDEPEWANAWRDAVLKVSYLICYWGIAIFVQD